LISVNVDISVCKIFNNIKTLRVKILLKPRGNITGKHLMFVENVNYSVIVFISSSYQAVGCSGW
jgi:hypothetical protein